MSLELSYRSVILKEFLELIIKTVLFFGIKFTLRFATLMKCVLTANLFCLLLILCL